MQKQIELNLLITVDVPEIFSTEQKEKYLERLKKEFFRHTELTLHSTYPNTIKEIGRVTTKAGQTY